MSKWKKILGKKWTFPAIYITAAALILALMWWYQDPTDYPLTKEELGLEEVNPILYDDQLSVDELAEKLGESIPVSKAVEQMKWPVENADIAEFGKGFFDVAASDEELKNAIVSFQDELWPHAGIDIVSSDKTEFNVVAALSGEVIRAEKDPVVGYIVEISHGNGFITSYSSLADLQVAKGDKVTQGAILGKAGRNIFEKEEGIHVHFETRHNDIALNPNIFLGQDFNQVLAEQSKQD